MLNEQKTKEQIALAILDQNEGKSLESSRVYYKSDYLSKELFKSFFSGTLSFIGITVLILLKDLDALMTAVNQIDYDSFVIEYVALYLAYLAIYFIITWVVYIFRFDRLKKTTKTYRYHLKRLNKIYAREDK